MDDDKFQVPFTKIEKVVFQTTGLSLRDIKVYGTLKGHYNAVTKLCFPSERLLSEETRLSIRTIQRSRKKLRDARLIRWKEAGIEKKSCLYEFPLVDGENHEKSRILLNLKPQTGVTAVTPPRDDTSDTGGVSEVAEGRCQESHPNKNKEIKIINKSADAPPPANAEGLTASEKKLPTREEVVGQENDLSYEEWRKRRRS